MSQENVELHHRANDAFNRRDLDAFLAFFDPDLEFSPLILELEGGRPYRGHDEIRSFGVSDVAENAEFAETPCLDFGSRLDVRLL